MEFRLTEVQYKLEIETALLYVVRPIWLLHTVQVLPPAVGKHLGDVTNYLIFFFL